jgi:hypothetical protein
MTGFEWVPFHVRMATLGTANPLAVHVIQRGKPRDRSVSFVGMGLGAHVVYAQWQAWLSPLRSLI